jgi:hypothetical protein
MSATVTLSRDFFCGVRSGESLLSARDFNLYLEREGRGIRAWSSFARMCWFCAWSYFARFDVQGWCLISALNLEFITLTDIDNMIM